MGVSLGDRRKRWCDIDAQPTDACRFGQSQQTSLVLRHEPVKHPAVLHGRLSTIHGIRSTSQAGDALFVCRSARFRVAAGRNFFEAT